MKKHDEAASSRAARSTELVRSMLAAATRPGGARTGEGGREVATTGGAGVTLAVASAGACTP